MHPNIPLFGHMQTSSILNACKHSAIWTHASNMLSGHANILIAGDMQTINSLKKASNLSSGHAQTFSWCRYSFPFPHTRTHTNLLLTYTPCLCVFECPKFVFGFSARFVACTTTRRTEQLSRRLSGVLLQQKDRLNDVTSFRESKTNCARFESDTRFPLLSSTINHTGRRVPNQVRLTPIHSRQSSQSQAKNETPHLVLLRTELQMDHTH